MRRIKGKCPLCGEGLAIGTTGRIVCSNNDCTDRLAVYKLLTDPERHHIVTVDGSTFALKHPLRERIEDELLNCNVHALLATSRLIPSTPGEYRVLEDGNDYRLEAIA